MIEEKLKLLGLNNYEIKAYLTLLHKGKSKASFISQDSKVPNGKIYDTLVSLENKGLVAIIPEEVKRYVATPIKNLKEILKQKEQELKELNKKIEELENIQEERQEGRIILVRGKRNFHKIVKETPTSETFSYNIKWKADVTDMNFMQSVNKAIKRKINLKTLYDYNTPKENLKIWQKKFPQLEFDKKINADGIAMTINDSSIMISNIELNSTVLIKSRKFAQTMKELFEAYYDNYKIK